MIQIQSFKFKIHMHAHRIILDMSNLTVHTIKYHYCIQLPNTLYSMIVFKNIRVAKAYVQYLAQRYYIDRVNLYSLLD